MAENLYHQLWNHGVETLYDDRPDHAAGVKFNDADLLGLPLRLVASLRNLDQGFVELKKRSATEMERIPIHRAPEIIAQKVQDLCR